MQSMQSMQSTNKNYTVEFHRVTGIDVCEGTALANKANFDETIAHVNLCTAAHMTPLRVKVQNSIGNKPMSLSMAKNLASAVLCKEIEQATLLNPALPDMNVTATQQYTLCTDAKSPVLSVAAPSCFYRTLIHSGDKMLGSITHTGKQCKLYPGVPLQRTCADSYNIAVSCEMLPEERESLHVLGALASKFTLKLDQLAAVLPPITPLQLRMTMDCNLSPVVGKHTDLRSGMVIRTNLTPCPTTGECKTLRSVVEHIRDNVSPAAHVQLGAFMSAVVVKTA